MTTSSARALLRDEKPDDFKLEAPKNQARAPRKDASQDSVAPELLADCKRIVEAMLFASAEPLEDAVLAERLPDPKLVGVVLEALRADYSGRGVILARAGRKYFFKTAEDLGWLLRRQETPQKKLNRAAIETLAIIAYHQPVTRAEIEDIRGVAISKGTVDILLETGWIRLRGRRKAPGRPITYGTTERFLVHFSLEQVSDLPGLDELRSAGLFDGRLPPGFGVPRPDDSEVLTEDEDPLDGDGDDLFSMAPLNDHAHDEDLAPPEASNENATDDDIAEETSLQAKIS